MPAFYAVLLLGSIDMLTSLQGAYNTIASLAASSRQAEAQSRSAAEAAEQLHRAAQRSSPFQFSPHEQSTPNHQRQTLLPPRDGQATRGAVKSTWTRQARAGRRRGGGGGKR